MIETVISALALGVAIIVPMLQYFVTIGGMQENINHLQSDVKEVKDVCTKVAMLETKIEPFWRMIDEQLPLILKGKEGRIDILLTKYNKNPGLTDSERWELIDLLTDKFNDTHDIGTKIAVSLLVNRLKVLDVVKE